MKDPPGAHSCVLHTYASRVKQSHTPNCDLTWRLLPTIMLKPSAWLSEIHTRRAKAGAFWHVLLLMVDKLAIKCALYSGQNYKLAGMTHHHCHLLETVP